MLLESKRILLIVGGGIAAYKSLELVRRLRERGAGVRAIMTRAAHEFVTPLAMASLTGQKVYNDLFSLTDEAEMGHIELSRDADLLVVAPATADLMAKMAHGHADDLASTALLATDKRILAAPAMNVRMWLAPSTQRNVACLAADGVAMVGPNEGDMACGEYGPGRMAEPAEIVAAIEGVLGGTGRLSGRHVLVTSGPTHEPIDPVRYIANRSSGRQGHAIAAAAAREGARVTLVSGPAAAPDPAGIKVVHIETARDMLAACEAALPCDVGIFAAAVGDWRVEQAASQKMKKMEGANSLPLSLVQNPDVLVTIGRHPALRPGLVVGFAAETENVLGNAEAKLARKGADWIVANDVSPEGGVMGGARNRVHLVSEAGIESWPDMSKEEVARALVLRIADRLDAGEREAGS